ncbi:methyltransferase [Yoonia sediminilitoris]|uniref:methyltransferase n=1 Tax=Yoonia sediminilitoris TaxID=1286148 RepID=UPI0015F01B35|nr:methyltransferase [Yoonia sediminilitoris]
MGPIHHILMGVGVLALDEGGLVLTPEFASAWERSSDDIRAMASFFRRAAADIAMGFEDLASDLPAFMEKSATFRLFRYDMAEGTTPAHLEATAPWVNYVEALSRIEAPLLAPEIDLGDSRHLLEIGGNTGVMAVALMAHYDGLAATVFDLPAVCALGKKRRDVPGLSFVAGDARKANALAPFEGNVDAVMFKSVLHDWPEEEAVAMLKQAADLLPAGGRLTVCERQPFGAADAAIGDTQTLGNLVFAPFYRPSELYSTLLSGLGFEVQKKAVALDTEFHIVTGVKQ